MFWNRVRQALYGAMTVAGLIWPGYFIAQFITTTQETTGELGFDVTTFFNQAWVNATTGFIAADLTIALVVSIAFMVAESRRLKLKFWGIYIGLIFGISFAFGFSLFMLMRERKLAESLEAATT
ncbi:MAG: DUF2834 domain-containing protein [Cyanobacteria bacterium P01_F01_bin.150]